MKRSLFRHITTGILCAVLLLSGVGCKGLSEKETAAIRPVKLSYWTIYNDVNQLRNFAKEYNAQRSYVNVNIRRVRLEEFDELFVNALADDVGPDIISVPIKELEKYRSRIDKMPDSATTANFFIKGKYTQEPVVTFETNPLPSKSWIKGNYIKTISEDVISGNTVYGLPLAVDTLAVYYNKDLLDRAGIPTPPTNWTELTDAVKKATIYNNNGDIVQSGIALGTGSNIANSADIFAALLMQKGINVAQRGYLSFTRGMTGANKNDPAYEVTRFYTDFARPTKEVYSWSTDKERAFDAFVQNKSVFYIGFSFEKSRITARAPQMNLEIIPLPQLNEAEPVNVASYWIESVVKKSKHKDHAWDFIRFITLPENIEKYSKATNQPSPLRSQIVTQSEDPFLGPFASQILTAKNWYRGTDATGAYTKIKEYLDTIIEEYPEDIAQKRQEDVIQNLPNQMQRTN